MNIKKLELGKYFALLILLLSIVPDIYSQNATSARGTVASEQGELLIGVNILLNDGGIGTITDLDGSYTLSYSPSASDTLIFSYAGFISQKIPLNGGGVYDIILRQDEGLLAEVVVVGYGVKRKAEVIGSIAQVSGEKIKQNPAVNFTNSLAGRLPGLVINQTSAEPGRENIDILIRGRGTFDSDPDDDINPNEVLIVIDGVIGADGLSGLDPQDIESVSVLKDGSAAIYGSRAANGVILVTTKRGKFGKPILNYSINRGSSRPTRFAERASALVLALQTQAIIERDAAIAVPRIYTSEEIESFRSPSYESTDWYKAVYDKTSTQTRHSLSLRGGAERVNYFLSLGTAGREGIINTDNSTNARQYNFRSNIDVNPVEQLRLSLDLTGRFDKNQHYASDAFDVLVNTANGLPTDIPLRDGKPIQISTGSMINPMAHVQDEGGYKRVNNTLFNGKIKMDYEIPYVSGLSIGGWAALRFGQNFNKDFQRPFTQYIIETDNSLTEQIIGREVKVQEEYRRDQQLTVNANITFQRAFGRHSLITFLAYEQSERNFNSTLTSRRGFLSSEVDQLNSGSIDTQENDASAFEEARQNYLGRFSYDFDKKYFAQFHFRYDGSFNFPSGRRFGFFPGVSLGWRISEENFLKDHTSISNLKLRASWALLGNDRVPAFQYLNRFGKDGSFPFGTGILTDVTVISQIGVIANPDITWETSEMLNFGIDAGFFNDRLYFELDFFKEKREDILAKRNVSIPLFVGVPLDKRPNENIGRTENKGFEAIVGYRTRIGKVGFDVEANMAYAKNNLVFQDATPPVEPYQNLEGRPIGSELIYDVIGIYRSQSELDQYPGALGVGIGDLIYADTNGDGSLTPADRIAFENTNTPEIQYGINLGANYGGFELDALFQGQSNANLEIRAIFGQGDLAYVLRNAYTPSNSGSNLPRIGGPESSRNGYDGGDFRSTFWQRDASFLRLKTLQLAYSFPRKLIGNVGISNLKVYISGSNLLTFDGLKKDGLADPELVDGLAWQIPLQRIFNIGANITF